MANAGSLRVLHLACHGYFDPNDPLSSGILASDNDPSGAAAVLSARDLLGIHTQIDLVALSACESGISEVNPGDELMGLSRSLLVGGARSVLASKWKVNDLSTRILMRFFYESWLVDGKPRGEALRSAQLRCMRLTREEVDDMSEAKAVGKQRHLSAKSNARNRPARSNDRIFSGPTHWAAFTMVGDWR